jgi:ABC-2 type transport system ATP-binding protein
MEVVERLCTRVAIIHRGRIVAEGTMADLRARAETGGGSSLEEIFLKLTGAEDLQVAIEALRR